MKSFDFYNRTKNDMVYPEYWRELRASLIVNNQAPKSKFDYVKSVDEEVKQLKDSIGYIKETISNYSRTKNRCYLEGLLSQLRKLICWKLKNNQFVTTYNPLLFRVAAYKNLYLPMYGFPKEINDAFVTNNPIEKSLSFEKKQISSFNLPLGHINKVKSGMSIIDFQEWLDSILYVYEGKSETLNQFILALSNKIGAHYDPTIPIKYKDLISTAYTNTLEEDILYRVADLTLHMGTYILYIHEGQSS